jgi:hypothetical protein
MNARRTVKIATLGLSLSLAALGVAGCSGGGSNGSLKKFCTDYVSMANTEQAQTVLNDSNNGDLSIADPSDHQALQHVAAAMQKLAHDAPTAIRAEAQLAAKGLKEMASGKPGADIDAGSTAGDHVDSYAQDQCPGATAAAAQANATPTTQPTDSFGGAGTSSVDNGSDSSSYNDNSSSSDSCDDSSIDC